MKKRVFSLLLTLVMVLAFIPMLKSEAEAGGFSGTSITQGLYYELVEPWAQGADDLIGNVSLASGTLPPGMWLTYDNSDYPSVVIKGTPTEAGVYTGSISCYYKVSNGTETGAFSITVLPAAVVVTPEPTPTPPLAVKITKHPGGETVQAGDTAVFTAGAENYKSMVWCLLNADNSITVRYDEAMAYFPGLSVITYKTTSGREGIELSSIPLSLNGWKVVARFVGNDGNTVYSNGAKIVVTEPPTPSPSPSPTPSPTPEPTATPQPTAQPTQEPAAPDPTSMPSVPVAAPVVSPEPEGKDDGGSGFPWWAIALIALAVILVGVTVFVLISRRPKNDSRPRQVQSSGIRCDKCGWECPDPNSIPRFCPQCGDPIGGEDIKRSGR